jgi:hypothetical protein
VRLHLLLLVTLAAAAPGGLAAPQKKEFAMKLVPVRRTRR